jgi:hypothetical protein
MRLPLILVCLCTLGSLARAAECAPHCDYNHYFGPYLFSYEEPGLYAYPVCPRNGRCSPFLAYFRAPYATMSYATSTPVARRGRIEIRLRGNRTFR